MAFALTINRGVSVANASGVGFVLYAAGSLFWSPSPLYGALTLAFLLVSFELGHCLRSMRTLWIAFAVFLTLNLFLIPFGMPNGIFGNPNFFGCAWALSLASVLAYRLWIFLPIPILGLWLTQSRGALLGASAAIFIWTWKRNWMLALALAYFGLAAVMLVKDDGGRTFWVRAGIWQDTLNHLTLWGSGWNSFMEDYWTWPVRRNIGFDRASHAYNDILELLFELGIGVSLLWVYLIHVMSESRSEAKLIIWTYLALSLTFFPLHVWLVGHLVACTLGHLSRGDDGA